MRRIYEKLLGTVIICLKIFMHINIVFLSTDCQCSINHKWYILLENYLFRNSLHISASSNEIYKFAFIKSLEIYSWWINVTWIRNSCLYGSRLDNECILRLQQNWLLCFRNILFLPSRIRFNDLRIFFFVTWGFRCTVERCKYCYPL